jgi:hypothetical protein
LMAVAKVSNAQNVNWRSLNEEKQNLVYLNFGYDFGVTTQFGYGHTIKTFKPVLLNVDYSFPMGNNLVDDFKVRYGGQIELVEINEFSVTAKIYGNFRRYRTEMVRIASFGSEFSVLAGYYKSTWHIAGEFGYDKSITSNLKHSDIMKDNYPNIQDGWDIPSGGNYFYGIQASKSIGKSYDISLRLGAINAQGKDENALLPNYAQIGLIKRF